jgi:hypothetical protein
MAVINVDKGTCDDTKLNRLLFVYDQVLLTQGEDGLKVDIWQINNIVAVYSLEIHTEESQVVVFKGKHTVRQEITINIRLLKK